MAHSALQIHLRDASIKTWAWELNVANRPISLSIAIDDQQITLFTPPNRRVDVANMLTKAAALVLDQYTRIEDLPA